MYFIRVEYNHGDHWSKHELSKEAEGGGGVKNSTSLDPGQWHPSPLVGSAYLVSLTYIPALKRYWTCFVKCLYMCADYFDACVRNQWYKFIAAVSLSVM